MMFLKTMAQYVESEDHTLKHYLHRQLQTMQHHRGFDPIHISDITREDPEFCPRQVALHLISKDVPKQEHVPTPNQFMFDLGTLVQDLVSNQYLQNIAWGFWSCNLCTAKTAQPQTVPAVCENCGGTQFSYEEIPVVFEDVAVGNLDIIVQLPFQDKRQMVEIKTLERKHFEKLQAPKAEHTNRTRLYLGLIRSHPVYSKLIDGDRAYVLYVCKGWGRKDEVKLLGLRTDKYSPFQDFAVDYDELTVEYYRSKKVIPIKQFKESGVVPCGICSGPNDKRAQFCPKRKECFSGLYQAGEIYTGDGG